MIGQALNPLISFGRCLLTLGCTTFINRTLFCILSRQCGSDYCPNWNCEGGTLTHSRNLYSINTRYTDRKLPRIEQVLLKVSFNRSWLNYQYTNALSLKTLCIAVCELIVKLYLYYIRALSPCQALFEKYFWMCFSWTS